MEIHEYVSLLPATTGTAAPTGAAAKTASTEAAAPAKATAAATAAKEEKVEQGSEDGTAKEQAVHQKEQHNTPKKDKPRQKRQTFRLFLGLGLARSFYGKVLDTQAIAFRHGLEDGGIAVQDSFVIIILTEAACTDPGFAL